MTNPNILSSDENEQNVSAVKLWVERFSQTGEVGEIDVNQVREVLKTCGAKVEVSADSITRLQGYSEATRGKGLTEVWGKERKKEFKAWTEEQGTKYETEKGITLPTTKVKDQKTGIEKEVKTFGMRGYLEDLTSYATGAWTHDRYKEVSEARWEVGRIVRDGERGKTKRPRIAIPGNNEFAPAGYLPDFPAHAFEKILSWRTAPIAPNE